MKEQKTNRAQLIQYLLVEAEGRYSDLPRKMVRLVLHLDSRIFSTREEFLRWLVRHGLGRYIERFTGMHPDRLIPGRTDYEFVFTRDLLEDVRYLGHMIVSYLTHEHPEYMRVIDDMGHQTHVAQEPYEFVSIDFFTYSPRQGERGYYFNEPPRHGSYQGDSGRRPLPLQDGDDRFWRSIHKRDYDPDE